MKKSISTLLILFSSVLYGQIQLNDIMTPFKDSLYSIALQRKIESKFNNNLFVYTDDIWLFKMIDRKLDGFEAQFYFDPKMLNRELNSKAYKEQRKTVAKTDIDLEDFFYLVDLEIIKVEHCKIWVSVTCGFARIPKYKYARPRVYYIDLQYYFAIETTGEFAEICCLRSFPYSRRD